MYRKRVLGRMNKSESEKMQVRDLRYAGRHDSIYGSLDLIDNWMIYGHLTLSKRFQNEERMRLSKFHLLIRDVARRFTGKRDLNRIGWFLREEGNGITKRFHFHFGLTSENLENTTAEVVCRYMRKQWSKIAKSICEITPWDRQKTPRGIWYLTQIEAYELPRSRYFADQLCHWRMSTSLHSKIQYIANERINV
jgi:hypothetical protein